jgi:hypothetical protein
MVSEKACFRYALFRQGIYPQSKTVYNPGVVLIIEITTRDGRIVMLEGKVRWTKKAPEEFSHKMKSGVGIHVQRLLHGEDLFQAIFFQLCFA